MHRKSNSEKMIAIRDSKDIRLGRGKEHDVSTQIDILGYDTRNNLTTILATITRGIRHQIRVHLAANGTPIIGDDLYGKRADYLHLRSLGFQLSPEN